MLNSQLPFSKVYLQKMTFVVTYFFPFLSILSINIIFQII
ncbi:hypothetical protein HMPREF9431_00785 [Segatella oulorum F0390]|uniref:Uncharacterized protein n=1 Tax=Segatella oulorum F0390 TaxID=702438 RepID=G1WAE0_9BACT|nr:hypothetical protein HMPREF9431_00785 [Segatella oulorum F0390]